MRNNGAAHYEGESVLNILHCLAPEGYLRTAWYRSATDCLGPNKRFALWVQGCERGCKGCISPEMQSSTGGEVTPILDLAAYILRQRSVEGITISGGEPFYQADRLAALLRQIKAVRPDFGVIVFTGFTYAELLASGEPEIMELLAETDLLIDGVYKADLDDNQGLRGSSNQNYVFLTQRYCEEQLAKYRKNEVLLWVDSLRVVGIPTAATKELLVRMTEGEIN